MAHMSVQIPTIIEMPHRRYILDRDEDKEMFALKIGFSQVSVSRGRCGKLFEQKGGVLTNVFPSSEEESKVNSTLREIGGISEVICHTKISRDVDAQFMGLSGIINLSPSIRINRPAILLETRISGRTITRNGETVIPAISHNSTQFFCIAGGYDRPYIAAAMSGPDGDINNGDFEILTPTHGSSDFYIPPLQVASYVTKSPDPNKEDEYICSAASGSEVSSKRFKIVGYIPIKFAEKDRLKTPVIYSRHLNSTVSMCLCRASWDLGRPIATS
jgi:hypothetical protein